MNNNLQHRELIPTSVKSQHLQLVGSNNDARRAVHAWGSSDWDKRKWAQPR